MPLTIKASVDTSARSTSPHENFASKKDLYISAYSSNAESWFSYVYFGLPSGIQGKTILSAKMYFFSREAQTGTNTLTVERVTTKYSNTKLTWAAQPSTTTTGAASYSRTNPGMNSTWVVDVTAMMQTIALGTPWYGVRLRTNNPKMYRWHSNDSDDRYRPVLVIEWTDAPEQPRDLAPTGNRAQSLAKPVLNFSFVDTSGDITMARYHVRIFGSLANAEANTSPTWQKDDVGSTPELDLSTTDYGGVSVGGTVWWRVRVQDGSGLWSPWSDVAIFRRVAKLTVDITNPSPSGTPPFVSEPTPPFSWSVSGGSQVAYQAILARPDRPADWLWDSGKITATTNNITPPDGIIREVNGYYLLTLRVWDGEARETRPGDPTYTEQSVEFQYKFSTTVSPVTNLAAALNNVSAGAKLTWERATAPDRLQVVRNGMVLETRLASELLVPGETTKYEYTDRGARPRREHTWSIVAIVNGVGSSPNPTITGIPKQLTTTLSELGGGREVALFNPEVDATPVGGSTVHYVKGSSYPVLVTEGKRAVEGQVRGRLTVEPMPGVSIDTLYDRMVYFRDRPGLILKLSWVDQTIPVVIWNVNIKPRGLPTGLTDYDISFDFFQAAAS